VDFFIASKGKIVFPESNFDEWIIKIFNLLVFRLWLRNETKDPLKITQKKIKQKKTLS